MVLFYNLNKNPLCLRLKAQSLKPMGFHTPLHPQSWLNKFLQHNNILRYSLYAFSGLCNNALGFALYAFSSLGIAFDNNIRSFRNPI
jgi:hypothetical protein